MNIITDYVGRVNADGDERMSSYEEKAEVSERMSSYEMVWGLEIHLLRCGGWRSICNSSPYRLNFAETTPPSTIHMRTSCGYWTSITKF